MKANDAQLSRALDRADPAVRLYLLYGNDDAGANVLAARLGKALGAAAERIDLEGATLREDHARLAAEAGALSLFGDRRWVRVSGGEECAPAVEALLGVEARTEPVIVIAGPLKPSSALVKLGLAHPAVLATQLYKPDGARGSAQVVAAGRAVGLRIDSELARTLAEACANDRALIARECEKFALYLDAAPDRPRDLSRDVFDLLSADASETNSFTLVDAAFDGQPAALALALGAVEERSSSVIPVLRLACRRALMLSALRAQAEGGKRFDAVMAREASYLKGKEREAVARQVARWPAERLAIVLRRLFGAEEAVKHAGVGDVVAWDTLLAVARLGERLR